MSELGVPFTILRSAKNRQYLFTRSENMKAWSEVQFEPLNFGDQM